MSCPAGLSLCRAHTKGPSSALCSPSAVFPPLVLAQLFNSLETLGRGPERLGGCLATQQDVVAQHLMGGCLGAASLGTAGPFVGPGCGWACPRALPSGRWVWTAELIFFLEIWHWIPAWIYLIVSKCA